MGTSYSRWSIDEIAYLKENYSKQSTKEIAKALNRNLSSIRSKASELKLKSYTDITRQWTDEDLEFLKANYLDMTHKEMANYLGKTKCAVDLKLSRLGLKKEKYTYDKSFFEHIDTEDKAYWLGFIYADGYVRKACYCNELGIELQWRDHKHLRNFNKAINGNVQVTKRERKNPFKKDAIISTCQIRLYSKAIVDSLVRYKLHNGKSYDITFPNDIPQSLLRDFIRGFFDGDGCISFDSNKRKTISLDFCCASRGFLESLRSELYKSGIHSYIIHEKAYSDFDLKNATEINGVFYKNTYRLYIKGIANTLRMIEYLYGHNPNTYLHRKYKIAMDNYNQLAQRLPRRPETGDFLMRLSEEEVGKAETPIRVEGHA